MRKWGFKKKFCFYASISLALFVLVFGCIFAVVGNFLENKNKLTFYIPDGAPTLACAKLLAEDSKDDGVEYTVVSSKGIESHVTSWIKSRNADFCVLPLTDASLLLSEGEDYQALGVLTHGNFFLISEDSDVTYSKDNLSALVGKKIGFVQLGKLPGLIFRSILEEAEIEYAICSDLKSCRDDVVNLINIQATNVVKGVGYDLFAMPEPAATTKITKAGFYEVGNVQDLYGEGGYAQAVLVAKRSVIENSKEAVDGILAKLRSNNQFLAQETPKNVLSAIETHLKKGLTPSFTQDNLNAQAISRCGVYFLEGEDAKTKINATIARIQAVDEDAVKTFSEEFFR